MSKSVPLVSIIIPTLNEESYINACIQSVLNSDYPIEKLELIVVDGLSKDKTVEKALAFNGSQEVLKVISNKNQYTPHAFNLGIKNSNGAYILIISGHSTIEPNYISGLVDVMLEHNADLVGGVFDVQAKQDTKFSRAIMNVLSSKWGAGNSKSRIGVSDIEEADTASGMFRADIFEKIGMFDERLLRNQDIEFSKRIREAGGLILVTSHVKYSYFCRHELSSFLKQAIKNGYWVVNTAMLTGLSRSISMRHIVPLTFTLYVLLLPLAILIIGPIIILPLLLYIFLISKESVYKNNTTFLANFFTFSSFHFCYGLGSVFRLLRVKVNK